MQLGIKKIKVVRVIVWILFFIYLAMLIKAILFKNSMIQIADIFKNQMPLSRRLTIGNLIPFKSIIFDLGGKFYFNISNYLLANIIAFGPLGFLLPIVLKKNKNVKNIIFIAFVVSLTLELIQLVTGIGIFDVDDIILNIFGAIGGYMVYKGVKGTVNKCFQYTTISTSIN